MPEQLGLSLPVRAALGREDFVVAPSNAVAIAMIDAYETWPQGKMVLSGPEAGGKTHLAHVWAAETQARIIAASDLVDTDPERLSTGPLVIEDVPRIAKDNDAQTQMFHLHNMLMANGQRLLMTGTNAPGLWRLSLPDLQSRVDAAGHAALQAPEDELLAIVLDKLFEDRGIRPRDGVIPFLVTRMERSFAAARRIVNALDARSLAEKKEVTRSFASKTLDNLAE